MFRGELLAFLRESEEFERGVLWRDLEAVIAECENYTVICGLGDTCVSIEWQG